MFLEFGKQTETHPESHQSDKLGNASTPDAEMLEKARQHSQEQSMVENEYDSDDEEVLKKKIVSKRAKKTRDTILIEEL